MGLFKRKKEKPYRVVHYEGIDTVATDMPCTFHIENEVLYFDFTSGLKVT